MNHLGHAIARIVSTNSPEAIKNKTYSAITFWTTGEELRDIYTILHNGEKTQIKDFTKADRDALEPDMSQFGPVKVAYCDKWMSVE